MPSPSACAGNRRLRAAFVALLAGTVVVLVASPAAAHTRAQAASNLRSSVTADPSLPGVSWRLYAGGDLVEVVNTGPHEVLVLGYEGEPYLRVGPHGVFTNRNSPATYLNTDRYGDVAVPPRADAAVPPEWVRVGDAARHAWHDHRVHWMAPTLPLAVRERGTGTSVHVLDWEIPLRHAGRQHVLAGELAWVPGAPWALWLLAGLAVASPALIGLRGSAGGRAALLRPAAATVAAVALLNGIHVVDDLLAWPSPTLDVLFALFHTALFVGVGLVGSWNAWRGGQGPVLSLGIASGAVLFHQGLLQTALLHASQLPSIWPPPLVRLAVAASIGQAVLVAAVLVRANRIEGREPIDTTDAPTAAAPPPRAAASSPSLTPPAPSTQEVPT